MFLTPLDWLVLIVILCRSRSYLVPVLPACRFGRGSVLSPDLPWCRHHSRPIGHTGFTGTSLWTVFFFARLWRRAGIVTDVEFAELDAPLCCVTLSRKSGMWCC